jgi:predicted transglutaminase-like cysteine proteinase
MSTYQIKGDRIVETPELLSLLDKINREINKFPYRTDISKHDQLDYWTALIDQHRTGDCDDYALTKRKKLIEAGVPYECLIPTICNVGTEGHLVLIVRTDQQDLMLDNIESGVVPVRRVNYQWLYRLDTLSHQWVKLFS